MSPTVREAIIVPCTQEKIWDSTPDCGPVAAKDAYTRADFKRWRRYAERRRSPWFILSTKYGLIHPDTVISAYNIPVSAALANRALLQTLKRQGREIGLQDFDKVVLLQWERFQPLVRAAVGGSKTRCVLRAV